MWNKEKPTWIIVGRDLLSYNDLNTIITDGFNLKEFAEVGNMNFGFYL